MAKNFIRPTTRHSLAAFFLYYFFVGLRVFAESNADKSQHENNDFDVSIKTINGKIYVNWKTSSLWQNTTVYFLSSLHDDITNASHAVNVTVCHAFKDDKNSWKIEPVQGNLLELCNRSRKCGPVNADDLIVRATLTQELSCQLFTTCTNFEDVFRIQVVSIGGGREYSFQSGNMTILSENIPPFYKVLSTSYGLPDNTPITLRIIYFDPSELCGFGAKPTDNLQFVIQHYKEYDSKCFYLGQKTAPYTDKTTEVNFNDVIIRKTEVLYFDYAVKSLASNKTTSSQRLKFMTDRTSSTKCSIIGGVTYISWRPQWNCFDENIIEQAQFCFYDGPCFPVCEASFFANGTFRAARTYEDEIINVCRKRDDCKFISDQDSTKINNVSNKFINVLWSPETRRITCALFRTCMHYTYTFSVKAFSFNDGRERILDNVDVCRENTSPIDNNQPAVPHGVHAIDIQANQVTITWKSPRCELEVLGCEVHVIFNGEKTEKHKDLGTDGLNNIYEFTKKNLPPFEKATFQVLTECFAGSRIGVRSPLQTVTTKPSAPQFAPNLITIESVDKAKGLTNIRLTWEYRGGAQYLHGVPNETRIIGLVNKTVVVYEETINSSEKTTTLTVNQTQRCAFYQVKICNAPDLCSNYSNPPRRLRNCEIAPTPAPESPPPSSNAFWVVIIAVVTIFIVLVAVLITTYVYCQKRR
ncbi:---NA--- [Paramuricea clavata]|uniref:---NA n=1 Tax=Paramuricea clavata TaxID=317549 RepID=A0A7D9EAG3_PARCT|nr:---NA--- [Paramuricea clavata]